MWDLRDCVGSEDLGGRPGSAGVAACRGNISADLGGAAGSTESVDR